MVTITNDYFYVNGVRCDTVGLSCDTPPVPPMAEQDYTEWVTGYDSPKASPDGTFNAVQYTLTCRVFKNAEGYSNDAIYAYLVNANTLTISRLPGYYFKVLKVGGIVPVVKHDGKVIQYNVKFTLAPFRYFIENTEQAITNGQIENPGTRYSRPIYKITGRTSGNTSVTLTVNGQTFTVASLTDTSTTITIDADKLIVYDQAGTNLVPKTSGQIPFLAPGVNILSVSNGSLSVIGNWRSY